MSQTVTIMISDSLAFSHNCFIELNIKATDSHVFELGENFNSRTKKWGARKHSSLASQKVGWLKVGWLKPNGLIEVYAYVYVFSVVVLLFLNT